MRYATSIRSTKRTNSVYKILLSCHIKTGYIYYFSLSLNVECDGFFFFSSVCVCLCAYIFLEIQQFSFFPFLMINIFVDRCHVFTACLNFLLALFSRQKRALILKCCPRCKCVIVYIWILGVVCMCSFPFFPHYHCNLQRHSTVVVVVFFFCFSFHPVGSTLFFIGWLLFSDRNWIFLKEYYF